MVMLLAFLATLYLMAGGGVLVLYLGQHKELLPPSLFDVDWVAVFGYFFFWPITLISIAIYALTERTSQD